MSQTTELPALDVAEQLSRIYRAMDEAAKLRAEALKLEAERGKLVSEDRKLVRDRFLAPWTLIVATLGGFAAFFAAGAAFMRGMGGP